MKYGEQLQDRSIPAWRAYNIDYDDIKRFIKERTTLGSRTTSANVDAASSAKLDEDLFIILEEQHRRIDLFVKSKAREIQHRLHDTKRRLRQLSARHHSSQDKISASKLERYSRLESDVLKAGDEIRSLARFIGAQRTGFGKLLKKYKKWTASTQLEKRFREEVLSDLKSFTKYDLGPLLDEYSETLHNVRALYTNRIRHSDTDDSTALAYRVGSSIVEQLHASLLTKRKSDFDNAIATVPLGEGGAHASYLIHPENVVELQVSLMQHLSFYMSRSRQNSQVGAVALQDIETTSGGSAEEADYFWLAVDSPHRYAQEQRFLNAADQEARPGSTPQRSRLSARWTADENEIDAVIAARVGETHVQVSKLKKKHVRAFFDKSASFPLRRASASMEQQSEQLNDLRSPYTRDDSAEPLYLMASHRSRFVGANNSAKHILLATLDTGITLQPYDVDDDAARAKFPYAVLIVRQEGLVDHEFFETLEHSHLTERVRGFSMEYHAIWQICKDSGLSTPFWTGLLSQDIRKLPPPALKHSETSATSQTLGSAGHGSASSRSAADGSTTAVETSQEAGLFASDLEQPPLRAFRKKRKRAFPRESAVTQERYWSEYDHPEDGEDADGSYIIYVDPDEKSTLDKMVDKMSSWFRRPKSSHDEESLLHAPHTPVHEESSSEEETSTKPSNRRHTSYGTVALQQHSQRDARPVQFLPQMTTVCLIASAVILIVGYVLSATGRHRYGSEVHAGVLFALATSILFIIAAVVVLASATAVQRIGAVTAVTFVVIESIAAGGLLAQAIG